MDGEMSDLATKPLFMRVSWYLKLITDPGLGQYVTGMRRVFFEFLAQLLDHYANRFGFFPVLRSPDYLQHFPVRNRSSLLSHEQTQDIKLFRRQVDTVPTNSNHSHLKVDSQLRGLDFWKGLFGAGTPQSSSNTRQ